MQYTSNLNTREYVICGMYYITSHYNLLQSSFAADTLCDRLKAGFWGYQHEPKTDYKPLFIYQIARVMIKNVF